VQLVRDPDYQEIKSCQDATGDDFERAFEVLFRRYRHRVYSIAFRITGSSADAMDVVQEAFSLVFRKVEGFRFDSLFSTWLFRIVVNCSIDHRRREHGRAARATRTVTNLGDEEPADPVAGPAAKAETRELGDHVQLGIQQLSPKLGAILVLRYLEGMSYEDLAATLQLSMGTVKSRLARAHIALEKQLRGTLAPYGVPEGVGQRGLRKDGSPRGSDRVAAHLDEDASADGSDCLLGSASERASAGGAA